MNLMRWKVYKINEITGDIYKNHVWLARSLSDDSPGQSIKHLNQALRLSNLVKKLIGNHRHFQKIKN